MDNNLTVLYEDNQIIVVVKPQNVPTQADSSGDKDLLTMIKEYVKEKYYKPGEAYIGLVHRLDRPTGGVMVFARTSKAAARLQEQMKTGLFEKNILPLPSAFRATDRAVSANISSRTKKTIWCAWFRRQWKARRKPSSNIKCWK